jgi:hypothetical protein
MATDNLQTESGSTTPPKLIALALELEELHERVRRMEALLDGADSILTTIRYDDPDQLRANRMVEFLGGEIAQWRELERERDLPSDDIWDLWKRAEEGRLIRHCKPVLEPTT